MKKLAMLTALAMLIGSLSIAVPASAEQQMDLGCGWKVINEKATVFDHDTFAMISDNKAHSGKYSLYVKGTSADDLFRVEHASEYPARWDNSWDTSTWEVSFWVNSDDPEWRSKHDAMYRVQVGIFDGNGTTRRKLGYNSEIKDWSEPDANGWRKATYTFTYPIGAFAAGKPQAHVQVLGATLGVYIDDFQIKYVGTKAGLAEQNIHLFNGGDFEPLTETGENISDYGWTMDVNSAHTTAPNVDIVSDPTGNKMMRIQFPETLAGWKKSLQLHKSLSLPNSNIDWKDFVISFKMKGQYFRGNVEVGNQNYSHVAFLTGKVANTNEYATATPLENGWTQYDVKVGGKIEDSTIDFVFYDWNGEILIDDIAVRKVIEDETDTKIIAGIYPDSHIFDGGFDGETQKNIAPKSWSIDEINLVAKDFITRSTKFAYTGESSIYMTAPNGWVNQRWMQLRQSLTTELDPSKEYTFKAKVRTLSPEITLFAYLTDSSVNGLCSDRARFVSKLTSQTDGYAVTSITPLGNNWYEYTMPLKAYENSKPTAVALMNLGGLDATWIDDVSLTDADGKEYIVNGSFEDYAKYEIGEPYMILDGLDTVMEPEIGENTVYVPVKVNEAGLDFEVYFAIYNGGKLFKVQKTEYYDAAVGSKDIEATITLEKEGDYTAKVFVWNDTMVPYDVATDFVVED